MVVCVCVLQHWAVFKDLSELFIMVPALLGLKGNLEMTLASRLSTHANLGHLDNRDNCLSMIVGNMALIQASPFWKCNIIRCIVKASSLFCKYNIRFI